MIIGGSKKAVLKNIHGLADAGELNVKAELTDPVFTSEQSDVAIKKFYKYRKNPVKFWFTSRVAYATVDFVSLKMSRQIKVEGLENLRGFSGGAIVTSNHFNPLDNLAVRKAIKKGLGRNIFIVSQETNLALPGFLGYLLNHLNILPITKSAHYLTREFKPRLAKLLADGEAVLIYPEEEMWFNYRKPRPCKRGAYQFAAENAVPVIPLFVEMRDLEKMDNEEFSEVELIVHVLPVIYPDEKKSPRENSIEMAEKDYHQKCKAYEKAYGKKLNYKFSSEDIAGWRGGKI